MFVYTIELHTAHSQSNTLVNNVAFSSRILATRQGTGRFRLLRAFGSVQVGR